MITTNFDPLFERAAERLGFPYRVTTPSGPFRIDHQELQIWKVHGSVDSSVEGSLVNLHATMPTITQPNVPLLASIQELLDQHPLCLVAYSGRDIDLFPGLVSISTGQPILWFDLVPQSIAGRAQQLNARVIQRRVEDAIGSEHPEVLQRVRATPEAQRSPRQPDGKSTLDAAKSAVAAGRQLDEMQKELLLSACLLRIGQGPAAYRLLSERQSDHLSGSPRHRLQTLLLLARLTDVLSNYRVSEDYASAALTTATQLRRRGLSSFTLSSEVQALHAVAMARKMRLGPMISLPEVGFKPRLRPVRVASVAVTYVRHGWRMRRLVEKMSTVATGRDPWLLLAWNRYLDHRIVACSFLMPLERYTSRLISWILHDTAKKALSIGQGTADAAILAHTEKQLQFLGQALRPDVSLASQAYELTGDHLNKALLHRNQGESLLEQNRLQDARREFSLSLSESLVCGSYATALKTSIGLHRSGGRVDPGILQEISDRVSGEGYEELATAVGELVGTVQNDRSSPRRKI